jgi:hypothetical protein
MTASSICAKFSQRNAKVKLSVTKQSLWLSDSFLKTKRVLKKNQQNQQKMALFSNDTIFQFFLKYICIFHLIPPSFRVSSNASPCSQRRVNIVSQDAGVHKRDICSKLIASPAKNLTGKIHQFYKIHDKESC